MLLCSSWRWRRIAGAVVAEVGVEKMATQSAGRAGVLSLEELGHVGVAVGGFDVDDGVEGGGGEIEGEWALATEKVRAGRRGGVFDRAGWRAGALRSTGAHGLFGCR